MKGIRITDLEVGDQLIDEHSHWQSIYTIEKEGPVVKITFTNGDFVKLPRSLIIDEAGVNLA